MSRIIRAARYAAKCHAGQVRRYTGAPYIYHPMRVAGRLTMRPNITDDEVAAAWLHDVIEDCGVTREELSQEIGNWHTGRLVQELTNPSKGLKLPRAERKQIDRDHIAKISKPAKLIKLIDRIDNLREVPESESQFLKLYREESRLLLEVLRGTDAGLEAELESLL